eukprot:COSAG06_NODE_4064_length_4611_cov_23.753324_4_plen_429_part_00
MAGDVDSARRLLDYGADVNAIDTTDSEWKLPALVCAAMYNHGTVVDLLVERGADLAATDGHGLTALHWAARQRHEAIIELLLRHKVPIDVTDETAHSWTPLHYAAFGGHVGCTQLLLAAGADATFRDSHNWSALQWAKRQRNFDVVELLTRSKSTEQYSVKPPQEASFVTGSPCHRVALCIGIGAYGGRNTLASPKADAEDMGACAREMGFDTVVLTDVTKQQIMRAVRDLRDKRIQDGSIVMFFFSGHGAEHNGTNYLIPLGMDTSDPDDYGDQAVSLDNVMGQLNLRSGGTINLVFLDCCRANDLNSTFKQTKGGRKKQGMGAMKIAPLRGGANGERAHSDTQFMIGMACDPGTVAYEYRAERNGKYTKALLQHLPTQGASLDASLRAVRKQVLRETENSQRTWNNDCLLDEIILVDVVQSKASAV